MNPEKHGVSKQLTAFPYNHALISHDTILQLTIRLNRQHKTFPTRPDLPYDVTTVS